MEPIDLHHLSAIRIGDRIVYNGVGGNAFAFGEKPDLAAFALGPYPNPNIHDSPITKSQSEPHCRVKENPANEDSSLKVSDGVKEDELLQKVSATPTSVVPPRRSSEPEVRVKIEMDAPVEPKSASDEDVDKNPFSEETNSDLPAIRSQHPIHAPEPCPGTDKTTPSLPSPTEKNTKTTKKPTLKEVALQAESAKSQHVRTGSWGALSNFGTKIANSTSALMTYTVNTTMNATQKALPLPPPPPRHRKLPKIPQAPLPFPVPLPPPPSPSEGLTATPSASKMSTVSSSSKSSSASSTPTKLNAPQVAFLTQEAQPDRRARPLSVPSPISVGLPPILPRPPAAHLPPPLPSRPPAAMRLSCPSSPSSSIKSSVSQRPSPDDDSDSDVNDPHEFVDSASGKGTGHVFRSSGTIRLDNRPLTPLSSATIPGSSSDTTGRRNSQSLSTSGAKPLTNEKRQANHSFSTISAAVVGSQGNRQLSKSPTPSSTISHQVSVSTPDLRSRHSPKHTVTTTSNHSSDDEGVFEGADTSDTLSAEENEVTTAVAQNKDRDKDTVASEQPQKKKITKQYSLDSANSNEMRNSNKGLFSKSSEKDEAMVKNRRRWFFNKKNDETNGESSTFEHEMRIGSSPNLSLESTQSHNSGGKEKQLLRPPKTRHKRVPSTKPKVKLDDSPNCRKCRVKFGFRSARSHCHRCRLAFCMSCAPVTRCDLVSEEQDNQAPPLVKLCFACKEELLMENSRGATRGLWSEFQKMRAEARDNRGLDVTSSTLHKHLESESVLDVTPGLRNLCIKFLVALHQQLHKQPRHKFLTNYLHFENPMKQQQSNVKKVKNCHACERYLRITSDIRECGICKQVFCMTCTWKTLQVYLPKGTDLRGDIQLEMIRFHVKETEILGKGEVTATESSEVYRVCASCEDIVARNIHVYEFDAKVPELEAELFDLQRQIDHCLTFSPFMLGMQRSVSTAQLNKLEEDDFMATCMKHANRLYDRYTRAYDTLNKLMPQTGGQKALHKHIKQAMYDFYLKRRDQLKTTWRRRDSCENIAAECNKEADDVPSYT